jgi:hypothetical protein
VLCFVESRLSASCAVSFNFFCSLLRARQTPTDHKRKLIFKTGARVNSEAPFYGAVFSITFVFAKREQKLYLFVF